MPFVQQHVWAAPDWVFLRYEDEELVTFYNVVLREVNLDGVAFTAAGINNVITPVAHRGKGYSSDTLRKTESFLFDELKADIGLLLCADTLVPFYSRLGWYTTDAIVHYSQPDGMRLYDSNTMLLTPDNKLSPKLIDLNGLPW